MMQQNITTSLPLH